MNISALRSAVSLYQSDSDGETVLAAVIVVGLVGPALWSLLRD